MYLLWGAGEVGGAFPGPLACDKQRANWFPRCREVEPEPEKPQSLVTQQIPICSQPGQVTPTPRSPPPQDPGSGATAIPSAPAGTPQPQRDL